MKSRKGITLIEILVLVVICFFLLVVVGGGCLMVKGCNYVVDKVETTAADIKQDRADRLEVSPPKHKAGDVIYHKASDEKMIVADPSYSWNDIKEGWNMKVKNGGNWDQVGGKTVNETEVKTSLEPPEVKKI